MIGKTGIWSEDEAWTHAFSYYTAKYIGDYFEKDIPVIDLGCGKGTYCQYLKDRRFENVIGIEGSDLIESDFDFIHQYDLSKQIEAKIKSGNVISIEVFEHIPKQFEDVLVSNIIGICTGKLVLSVAVEGQPGLGHVNCRNNDYVIRLFEGHGFKFQAERTKEIRSKVEPHVDYLRNTLMVFEKQ
jgi:SAM-dependent methyltransferase